MKNSPHLVISDEPLKEGQDYAAICGRKIVKAAWVFTDEDIVTVEDFIGKLGNVCGKCRKVMVVPFHSPVRLVVYGAVDGQIAKVSDEF